MIKISDIVKETVHQDEIAYEALRLGWLNLNAYAEAIQSKVAAQTLKPVKKASIVVALSRYSREIQNLPSLKVKLNLYELVVKSPLSVLSYEKTQANLINFRQFLQDLDSTQVHFVGATQGSREVTLIVPTEYQAQVERIFSSKPKAIFTKTVGMSVSFSDTYLKIPNIIHTIMSALAVQHINVIEVVSTYTELTLIIEHKDLERATKALQVFLT